MRLSDAIREGSKYHRQTYQREFAVLVGNEITTCALGAAVVGFTVAEEKLNETPDYINNAAGVLFDTLDEIDAKCPACDTHHGGIGNTAAYLNDDHHWTREKIADWLEGLGY